jgi:hypothetical protein
MRLEFDGGQWWEIDTDPPFEAIRRFVAAGRAAPDDADPVLLAACTIAWSFPEAVTPAAVSGRRTSHYARAMEVVLDEVLPLVGRIVRRTPSLSTAPSGKG